jgi:hypothetical protein
MKQRNAAAVGRHRWVAPPGHDDARASGCICPVVDNNRGLYAPRPPRGWWTRPDCRLHGMQER